MARFASWTPGLRIDGSRLSVTDGAVSVPLGVVTSGVLDGTEVPRGENA